MRTKRWYILLLALLLCLLPALALADGDRYVEINEANFPDPIFRQWVMDTLAGGKDYMTEEEVADVTEIDVSEMDIQDLTGIEHFTALEELDCSDNRLTALDVSKNTALTGLNCDYNQLTALDVSKNTAVTELYCGDNPLTVLDVRNNLKLTSLYCFDAQLTTLDISQNLLLTDLCCSGNRLSTIDVSKNTALQYLECSNNRLSSLDLSKNTALQSLGCSGNQLTALNVSKNAGLEYLHCKKNRLTSLDLSRNTILRYMRLGGQRIAVQNLTQVGSKYICDLKALVPDLSKVNVTTEGASYDRAAGTVTLSETTRRFTYRYDTGRSNMEVTVSCDDAILSYLSVNEYNFPDPIFRQWVVDNLADGNDYMTEEEVADVTEIDVSEMEIQDLTGIEHFTELTELYCQYNLLTSLNVGNCTKLVELDCGGNQLTGLNVSRLAALEMLYCGENQLSSLDVSKNRALTDLSCQYNQLTALSLGNCTKLVELDCGGNRLTGLTVSRLTALEALYCGENQLSSLDVSKNTALWTIYCNDNQLTALNVSKNKELTSLSCQNNQLTSLNVSSCTQLAELDCGGNRLTGLTVSRLTALEVLYCGENQLSSLDVSKNTELWQICCNDNQLTALDVSKNTALTDLYCQNNQLTSLNVSRNTELERLDCSGNRLSVLDLSSNTALYEDESDLGGQQLPVQPLMAVDDGFAFALGTILPDFSKVTITTERANYNSATGVVTFDEPVDGFTYAYNTGRGMMEVTVRLWYEEPTLIGIAMAALPETLVYLEGTELSVAGGRLTLTYDTGAAQEIDLTLDMIGGYDPTKAGVQTLTVTYEDRTTAFEVTVEHVPGEPVIENEAAATCAAEGSYDEVVYCTACAAELSREKKAIEKLPHTPGEAVKENEVAPTCGTEGGYDMIAYCTVCHEEASREHTVIEKTGDHTPGEPVIENEVPAICVADGGYDEVVHCTVCGEVLSSEHRIIEKSGEHVPGEPVRRNVVPATSTTRGHYDEVVYCTVCGEELSREEKAINKSVKGLTIVGEPEDATVKNGEKAKFTVKINGKATAIQWYYRTSETARWKKVAAKGNKLTLTVIGKPGNKGYQYRCELKNGKKKLYSDTVTLDVELHPPILVSQPEDVAVKVGETATFTFGVEGEGVIYTWIYRKPGVGRWAKVKGSTEATLTVTGKVANDGCKYACEAKNKDGKVISAVVTLDVEYHLPKITTQPKGAKVKKNAKVTFTVEAENPYEEELTFQWYSRKNAKAKWTKIKGATEAAYSFKATAKKSGYQYKCDIGNRDGIVSTKAVTLKVK